MIGGVLDLVLAVLVVAVAGWTIAVRDAFAATIGFIALGLLLALVWWRLAALDVALTEAAIGGGLIGWLLLNASARLRGGETASMVEQPSRGLRVVAGVLCGLVTAQLAVVVLLLPDPAPTLAPAVLGDMAQTGLGNPVAAVLISYRAVDTLLETVVLLLALVGVWSLARDSCWGGAPGLRSQTDRDDILPFMVRILVPIGIVIGVHILWVGNTSPGGKFQGAAILAAMWILAVMTGITEAPAIRRARLRLALIVGPTVFLAVGLAGFGMAGDFLAYPAEFAKPLILAIETTLTLSVATTLGLIVAGPPERLA
jgi:multisubunit Na+/H+ antiporter MnhB subunit